MRRITIGLLGAAAVAAPARASAQHPAMSTAQVETAARLLPVLWQAAAWQGLDEVHVVGRGDLAPALRAELAA